MILTDGQALNFAPQALGEVAPIASATGYFYADQGIELLNRFALYGQMYRGQPWVATVVDKVSNSAARLSFNSWDNSGAGEKVLDTQSPFAQLWRRPCPFMHRYAFWRWTFSTYEIYGEAFWLKLRAPGSKRVIGLLPMHPSRTIVKRLTPQEQAELGYASNTQYIFSLSVPAAGLLKVPEEDVVPFLRYNPDDLMRGVSRIEPLRTTLYNEDASRRAIESWWKRGARPSLMISSPQGLSDKAYERLQATVSKVHGGADQMGGTIVLEEGAKPVPVQLSAEEMQYIQARTLNREEVCGVYDVPPPVVHILDHATFCLPADARVSTPTGPVRIADVSAGDVVYAFDGQRLTPSPVARAGQTGVKELWKVRTANRTLFATDNHPVLVARRPHLSGEGNRARYGEPELAYVPVGVLAPGDLIVTAHGYADESKRQVTPTGRPVTQMLMEFLGIMLGDGTINAEESVSLAHAADARHIDHYRHAAQELFTRRGGEPIKWHAQSDRSSRFSSASAARELRALGVGGGAHTKSIPGWVFECDQPSRLSFLRGLFEADHPVDKKGRIAFSLCNENMVRQAWDLCVGLGISVTNIRHTEYEVKLPNGQPFLSTMWQFSCTNPGENMFIGSWDPQDFERIASGKPFNDAYYRYADRRGNVIEPPVGCRLARVKEVGPTGDVVPVFDLTVPAGHSFIAEGVIVHNSNITEQMRSMYRDTMAPRLEDVESVVEHHLTVPDFPEIKVEGRFALDEVLRGDFETRATAVGSLIEKGVMKPSEARPLFDLDDAGPVADKLYANSALQELGTPAARITVTDRTAVATPGETAAATEANQEVANEIDSERPAPKQPPPTAPSSRAARRRERRRGQWSQDTTEETE